MYHTDGGMKYGAEAGIFFSKIYYARDFRNGIDLFHQPVYHSPGDRMEGRAERCFLFDKRNPWYSWGLPALRHFDLSKFVNVAQNSANLKFVMDILDKCVYNTTYAAEFMSAVISCINSGWGYICRLGSLNSQSSSFSRCIFAAKFSNRGTTRLESKYFLLP